MARHKLLLAGFVVILGCTGTWASSNTTEVQHSHDDENMVKEIHLLSKEYIQPISYAFLMTFIVATLLEKAKVHCIPESAVVIVVGAALGFGMKVFREFPTEVLHHGSAPAVNLVFLPLIIFESGWSLRHKDFAAQFIYILYFAVFGTFVAMMVVGTLICMTSDYHGITDRRTAFTFASLISATDPVATLATYSSLRVEPLLSIMVFGESTVNDAVAIVVFDILNGEEIYGPVGGGVKADVFDTVLKMARGITVKLLGSMFIGIGLAILYTLALKFADMKHATSMEILFIVLSCFFTFSTAEQVHMSGIIAVLFAGIFMGIYGRPHLSNEGRELASFFLKELATWADMAIFLLVGMDVVIVNSASWHFSLWVILFLLIGRAVATFPMGALANCTKKVFARGSNQKPLLLSWRHLFMMWHAGLRGGIALVLCLEMGDWVDVRNGPGTKQVLINTTVVIIVIFLLVFGGSTEYTLKLMGIKTGTNVDEGYLYNRSLLNCVHRSFEQVDRKVLSPILMPASDLEFAHKDSQATSIADTIVSRNLGSRGNIWTLRKENAYTEAEESESDDSSSA